jgi:hypothetical protein
MNPTSLGQHSFVRDSCGKGGSTSLFGACPSEGALKDSNNNAVDFFFVETNGTDAGAGQRLGAPGPENLTSPIQKECAIPDGDVGCDNRGRQSAESHP